MMFYALASKGYRLGGVNQAALDFPFPIPKTYVSDTLWNYELGARTTWNGGRTVLNATLFHVDWKDIQSTFRLALPPLPPFPYFVNAGTAHSTGIEFELTALLTDNWEFHTALTYLEAEIDEVSEVVGGISDVQPGAKLPGTPEFQASSWIRYMFTMFGTDSSVRFSHRYIGESNYDLVSPAVQGDYNVFDLLLNSQISDNWSLSLYVKNLADDDGVTSMIPETPGFADKRYLLRPRTIGLSLQGYF
jgi:outer membrane receptor protein involved in Fe transport